ncbi:MAG: TlyA family RNA methyltransferase [Chloroflexi bacterium]|nr:TlyA family RNA methyltransferase [Chloroflexota bacterium]
MAKKRIDGLLVERGFVETREKAKALLMAGDVYIGDTAVLKPGTLVEDDAAIRVREGLPFVSRGGLKLCHALDEFPISVASVVALDVGASTGGFTDCLLQRGALRVYALDVGYGQLDYKLRIDPRVVVMERVNAHYPFTLPEKVDVATLDVSFISLEKVLPNVLEWVKEGGDLIVLVKPQFEAGRAQVGKGGLVKDPAVHAQVVGRIINWAIKQGLRLGGLAPSPILGASGNREFLVFLRKQGLGARRQGPV